MIDGVVEIGYHDAVDFLLPRHYSGRVPNIKYAFGCFEKGSLVAVCTFGKPASHHLCIGVCGEEHKNSVFELNRLCTNGNMVGVISQFVACCLRKLKKHNLIIVSYADTQMGHAGYIYQALNFKYTGATKARTEQYTTGGKHSRHSKTEEQDLGLRKARSSKHRYVTFVANRRDRRIFESALKYPTEPYPKTKNTRYTLGEYLEPTVLRDGVALNPSEVAEIEAGEFI